MALMHIKNWKISGIAAAVPGNVVENSDYATLSPIEKKLLIKTTGIERKHVAEKNQTTSDLCQVAANKLLDRLSWNREDVDLIVFVSQSPDYYLPATAIILQDKLKLSSNCLAFDVGLGCSGYVYGLSIVASMISAGHLKKALLLVGDVSSSTVSSSDKSTYPLFGDAGTATAIEFSKNSSGQFNMMSDGSGFETIIIRDGGIRNKVSKESFDLKEIGEGISRCDLDLELDGLEVYNFSVSKVPPLIKVLMQETRTMPEDYHYFVMHQANRLMNETIRKKLKFTKEQSPYSLKDYGNTSSASIPLTICSELSGKIETEDQKVLLCGFGVGLSWGAVALNLDEIICLPIIEV